MEDKKINSDINLEDSILYNSLNNYMELTEEETKNKIIAYKNSFGEKKIKIKKEIIEGNLLLIHNACIDVIKIYPEFSLQYDELFSFGAESLINCLNTFDHTKKTPFSVYTYSIVRKQIISRMFETKYNLLKRSDWFIVFNNCRQEVEELTNKSLIDDYTLAHLINEKMYKKYYRKDYHFQENLNRILLTIPISLEESSDIQSELDIDVFFNHKHLKETINRALRKLTDAQKYVLEKRYGLIDGIEYEVGEISSAINCSYENVRQIEVRALKRLRKLKISDRLKEFY